MRKIPRPTAQDAGSGHANGLNGRFVEAGTYRRRAHGLQYVRRTGSSTQDRNKALILAASYRHTNTASTLGGSLNTGSRAHGLQYVRETNAKRYNRRYSRNAAKNARNAHGTERKGAISCKCGAKAMRNRKQGKQQTVQQTDGKTTHGTTHEKRGASSTPDKSERWRRSSLKARQQPCGCFQARR